MHGYGFYFKLIKIICYQTLPKLSWKCLNMMSCFFHLWRYSCKWEKNTALKNNFMFICMCTHLSPMTVWNGNISSTLDFTQFVCVYKLYTASFTWSHNTLLSAAEQAKTCSNMRVLDNNLCQPRWVCYMCNRSRLKFRPMNLSLCQSVCRSGGGALSASHILTESVSW